MHTVMKKLIYLICMAAVALTGFVSCSSEEEAAPNSLKLISDSGETVLSEDGLSAQATLPAEGGTITLRVETNLTLQAELENGNWCAYSYADGRIKITASENKTSETRTASIRLRTPSGDDESLSATISLTQQAPALPSLSVELQGKDSEIVFSTDGGSYTAKVNAPEGWTAETTSRWLTLTEDKANNTFTVSVEKNPTITLYTGTIIVRSGNGQNEAVAEIPVSQLCLGDAMRLTLNVGAASENVAALPFDKNQGYVNCVVDWGDGRMQHVCYSYPQHEYDAAGVYKVRIYGTVNAFRANDNNYFGDAYRNCIQSIDHWGNIGLTSLKYGFQGCASLKSLAEPDEESFSKLTTVYCCFFNCSALTDLPDGLFATAPKLTEAYEVFSGCEALEKAPARLFAGCTKLKRMFRAFWGCTALKSVGDDLLKDCTALTEVGQMFCNCSALTAVPANLLDDCTKLESVGSLFARCTALTGESPYTVVNGKKVHLYERNEHPDLFTDFTAKEINYKSCFEGCTKLSDYETLKSNYPVWIAE